MTTVNGNPIRRSGSRRALASAALVLLAGLVATVCASRWIRADAMRQDTARFGSLALSRWELVDERERAWLVACAGGALSLALSLLVFVQGHGRARAEELANELAESRELLKAGSEERARLSRQLHDDTIQTLFAIGLMLGRTRKEAGNREVVEQRLSDVSDQLDRAIADLRHYVLADSHIGAHEAPPTLARALEELARRWKLTHTAEFQLQADPETGAGLPPHAVADILMIAQEAVSNSLRHSKARNISIWLRTVNGRLRLEIADDGVGFKPQTSERPGHGLANMRQRATGLGGQFRLDSQASGTTVVLMEIPL